MMTRQRVDTDALGIEVLAAARDAGAADPIGRQTVAELVNEIANRAATKACDAAVKAGNGKNGNGAASQWTRWGVGILLVVFGAWWGMSQLFAERPTEPKVEKLIERRAPHPDTKAAVDANLKALQYQQRQLDRIEVGVAGIKETLDELKRSK